MEAPEFINGYPQTKAPCLVCGSPLGDIAGDGAGNQPSGGTEFLTHGHYGSAVSDFMDGTGLAVNICDPCLREARRIGRVLKVLPPEPQPRPHYTYELWAKDRD